MAKVELELLGQTYSLSCAEGQEEHLQALGKLFGNRVDELKSAIGDLGDRRLFLAAGLSLMEDLQHAADAPAEAGVSIADLDNRISLVERTAATALSTAATRITRIAERIEQAG